MIDIADYPSVLFLISAPVLWLAAWMGTRLSRRFPLDDDMRHDFSTMQAAALTLLALIIGFSFSMAAGRYDQRKKLEEAEANAIGTEYSRAALLLVADAAKLRPLLKAYLDHRVQYYTAYRETSTAASTSRPPSCRMNCGGQFSGPPPRIPRRSWLWSSRA